MAEPFLSEIRAFGFNFPPRGWAQCDGQLLSISQNTALFSLLGTIYGGDGRTTFALPDLRGRTPLHLGSGPGLTPRNQGSRAGTETETLTVANLPGHSHGLRASNSAAGQEAPAGTRVLGRVEEDIDGTGSAGEVLGPSAVVATGGGQPHSNMQPFLALNFCIALQGVYPSRS
ncbi:MAG: phage tail protein [Pirellulaceae bacterium]|nr:phage tail protein [Pirellulaceae bacterium]